MIGAALAAGRGAAHDQAGMDLMLAVKK